ncbi:ABC transporter substrate-binding protein [Maridesulfovibrio sp. FT414]|uniref:ABC transporter substrate-binding protein n=1 Tax=Maridesulfovibrio sp. FT414 TaxID=2979469 RepID=UPI003D809B6C
MCTNTKRLIILTAIIIGLTTGHVIAADKKKVVIIHSYAPSLQWTDQCNEGIESILRDHFNYDFIYLDSKRVSPSELKKRIDIAYESYKQIKPDLVMLGDDTALRELGPAIAADDTPIVYFGINNNPRNYFRKAAPKVTGILERTPIFPAARFLKKLLPEARQFLFLFDESPTTESIIGVTFKGKNPIVMGDVHLKYHVAKDWEEWKHTILNTAPTDIVIIATFHSLKDKEGNHVSVEDVVNWCSEHSKVPVFSCQDYTVSNKGTVGAITLYGYYHGRNAAKIAKRILSGELPSSIPPETDTRGVFYLNKEQLKRYKISIPRALRENIVFK